MKVCIAEKPSVAKEIANVLGASARRDGYFEGNGYAVSWTFGHFCELYSPDDYKPQWKRWDLNSLPMLPEKFLTKLKKDKGVKKQFGIVKKLFKSASVVINCGDAGQEGELIQRWVIKEAKYKGEVQRLWISSLTKEAIQQGFKDLRPGSEFDPLYFAGSARAIGDWLLGMNATRLYTLKYGGGKQVLSIGRVQTPTLAMLVNRHKEIEEFVSTPFWELETNYRAVTFRYEKGRFEKHEEGKALLDAIKEKTFHIVSSTKKAGKEYAPKLFDLTSLQVSCNKKFGFPADQTLKIVQKLYERKLVTYPRVDTNYLPNDMYPKIKGILSKMQAYKEFVTPLLSKSIRKSKSVFNDKKVTDHHAIIPTGVQGSMTHDEGRVYDLIARRFIANFYPECKVNNAVVIGRVEDVKFKAKGKEISDPGWKILFPKKEKTSDDDNKEEEGKTLPIFQIGESGPHEPKLVEKQTQPPKYYTDASLLRAMETAGKKVTNEELSDIMKENGIGRPSTRANIIETLFRRKYTFRKRKLIMATDLGIQLIDTIENHLLKSVELTGQWEKKLRMIEAKQYSTSAFIAEMKKMTDDLVTEVRMSKGKSKIDLSGIQKKTWKKKKSSPRSVGKRNPQAKVKAIPKSNEKASKTRLVGHSCPKCRSGKIIKGKTAYGCNEWKAGCNFRMLEKFMGKKISENQLLRLLGKSSTVKLKGFKQNGVKVDGVVIWDKDYTMQLVPDGNTKPKINSNSREERIICPKCKQGKVVKGKTAYGCSRWKAGCSFRYSFDEIRKKAAGKKMTKELVLSIISG
jgi:DNA topoisomerase-3